MKKSLPTVKLKIFYAGVLALFLTALGFFLTHFSQNIPLSFDSKKILPTPALYPENKTGVSAPVLTAKSVIIMDVNSEVVLFEKNSQVATFPASTTKIMSGLVALENFKLDEVLEVGQVTKVEGQKIKLLPGEKITFENLLFGLLVASANDAAVVLAENFPAKSAGFVWAMNQKAKDLGLEKTNFTNPIGYDEPGHYSTAADLAHLAVFSMKNPIFERIVSTEKITITDVGGKIFHPISNINTLVGKIPGVRGVKTGWTQQAGECLVTFIERDGKKIVLVVLGSNNRFKETEDLINWVFENFSWIGFNL